MSESHGPTDDGKPGASFWIRESADSQRPECQDEKFPVEYSVFDAPTFGGLENRFRSKAKKGNTQALKSDSYTHFKIIKGKP